MVRRSNSKRRLKKAQLSFYPEPEAYEALKELSRRTGVPQQVYLRRGLDHVLLTSDSARMRRSADEVRNRMRQRMEEYSALARRWKGAARPARRTNNR